MKKFLSVAILTVCTVFLFIGTSPLGWGCGTYTIFVIIVVVLGGGG